MISPSVSAWRVDSRFLLVIGLFGAAHVNAHAADNPTTDTVFVSGVGGYHTYRIPSVIVTKKGTVLAFCEGRKAGRSDAGDIDLVLRRSLDGGKTWQPLQVVWDDGANTCGNPCPVVDQSTGTIWLLLTHNLGADTEAKIIDGTSKGSRTCWVSQSSDDGVTWTAPREISRDVKQPDWTWYATGPGVGIQLPSGRMVIPCDNKVAVTKGRQSHVIYSDDHGATWKLGGVVGPNCNESQIVELSDGSLHLNMRSYQAGNRRNVAISKDGGLTFSPPREHAELLEPVCQASIVRYDHAGGNGPKPLLFSNPASTKREKLTVRVSRDDGATWPRSQLLHAGPAAYSCLTVLPDKSIGCLYECGETNAYERIVFARFSWDWLSGSVLKSKPMEGKKPVSANETKQPAGKFPSLPKAMASFGAARILDTLYVYGGNFGQAHHYSDAGQSGALYYLDLRQPDEWQAVLHNARVQGNAAVAHGGKLYLLGGFTARNKGDEKQDLWSSAMCLEFDPACSCVADLPAMPEPRSSFDAIVLNHTIYVAGGWNFQGGDNATWSETAFALNLQQKPLKWQPLPKPPFQRRALALGAVNDHVIVIGGMQPEGKVTRKTALFSPAKQTWTEGPTLAGEDMEGFGAACCTLNGKLYVSTSSGKLLRLSDDLQTWHEIGKLNAGRFFHRMLPTSDNELTVIAGASMGTGKFATCETIKLP